MSGQRSEEFTDDDLGSMQLAKARVLVAVARRRLDLNDSACQELANRGPHRRGMWVGFPKVRAIYERTRDQASEAAARPAGPDNIIQATITATMRMHGRRPAMNQHERRYTETRPRGGLRGHAFGPAPATGRCGGGKMV